MSLGINRQEGTFSRTQWEESHRQAAVRAVVSLAAGPALIRSLTVTSFLLRFLPWISPGSAEPVRSEMAGAWRHAPSGSASGQPRDTQQGRVWMVDLEGKKVCSPQEKSPLTNVLALLMLYQPSQSCMQFVTVKSSLYLEPFPSLSVGT